MMPAFDLLLCLSLLALMLGAVAARRPFVSVSMFIAFGMMMALTWARLGAADLALAEAAIGAGFTGALLLSACRTLPPAALTTSQGNGPRGRRLLFAACLAGGCLLSLVLLEAVPGPGIAAAAVAERMPGHPLDHGVTAVLLDFRGYDTLLEMGVLLIALLGLRLLEAVSEVPDPHPARPVAHPLFAPLVAVEVPVLVLMALYLFHAGAKGPGGAFQAGALLAAAGILLRLSGHLVPAARLHPLLRAAVVVGLAVFACFAWLAPAWSDVPLGYPQGAQAYYLMLLVEAVLMVSTAAGLLLLFGMAPGLVLRRPG